MKLSIIIVNYRGWKRLRQCLDSLNTLSAAPFNWEVIVVDNQSADGMLEEFVDGYPDFKFIENTGNFGFAHGCNLGARNSCGAHLLFLNPDTVATPQALVKLVSVAEERPDFTLVSCSQYTDDGKDDKPYGFFPSPQTLTGFLRAIHRLRQVELTPLMLRSGAKVIFPDWISGSVMLISRKNYSLLNGLNEDFWMYFEDTDLCKRINDRGGKVAFVQNIQVVHNHGGASRVNNQVKVLTKSEVIISKHVYLDKHFRGVKRVAMHGYLVINNLLLGHLLLALTGVVCFWNHSLKTYRGLYVALLKYYLQALSRRNWISIRSVNADKPPVTFYQTANAEVTG